jgi:hypothetical protein
VWAGLSTDDLPLSVVLELRLSSGSAHVLAEVSFRPHYTWLTGGPQSSMVMLKPTLGNK